MERYEKALRDEVRIWCRTTPGANEEMYWLPEVQKELSLRGTHSGRQSYPGFANLGNACYVTAVLQCLLHCADSRQALLDLPPTSDADVANDADDDFRGAIGCIAKDCFLGADIPDVGGLKAFFDVYAPTCLMQALVSPRITPSVPTMMLPRRSSTCSRAQACARASSMPCQRTIAKAYCNEVCLTRNKAISTTKGACVTLTCEKFLPMPLPTMRTCLEQLRI